MFERKQEFDAQGFPVPGGSDEFPRRDEMPEPADAGPKRAPASSRRGVRVMRLFLLVMFLGMGGVALYHSEARDYVRLTLAEWQARQAEESRNENDVEGALRHWNSAVALAPEKAEYLCERGEVRLKRHDVVGALEDFDRTIELNPKVAVAYKNRGIAFQRLERHEEAIADANRFVELTGGNYPSALNHRAYARAIANREIKEGLRDIEAALEIIGWNHLPTAERPADLRRFQNQWGHAMTLAAFLDTRGYLLHLDADHSSALHDIELSLELTEKWKRYFRKQLHVFSGEFGQNRRDARFLRGVAELNQTLNENLAVMYYHRSQIRKALGEETKAEEDERLALELGYNPALGVY